MEWDWENHDIFGSKEVAISSLKRLKSSEEINESFNLSGVVNVDSNSSIESSFKEGMEELSFSSEVSRSFHKTYSNRNGISPSLEASVCSFDQPVGLNIQMSSSRSSTQTCSSPNIHISSVSNVKKVKLTRQSTPIARCQVEGCNLDLSSAKEYHKKHRVCENHSKSSKVVLDDVERRFCQQCSRFHWLSEFDGKKRSCRQRLSDHNARRRKPKRERIQFNSRNGQQQVSFVFNNVPMVQTEPTLNSIWETTSNSQHAAGVFHQGSNTEALDLRRALSLLSSNSRGSCESDFSGLDQPMHTNGPTMAQQGMHSAHHGLPPEYWQVDQQSVDPHIQESHILKKPYGYY